MLRQEKPLTMNADAGGEDRRAMRRHCVEFGRVVPGSKTFTLPRRGGAVRVNAYVRGDRFQAVKALK
jgi:hypothetical protein